MCSKNFHIFCPCFQYLGTNPQRETCQLSSRKLGHDIHASGFGDVALDAKIEAMASELDLDRRNSEIAEFWKAAQERQLYIPIRHQMLNWGMKSGIRTVVAPDGTAMLICFRY